MTSAPAIGFEYRPSRLLRRALLGVAGLALLALATCALAMWLKLLLAAAVGVTAAWQFRQMASSPIVAAGWSDGGWTLHLAGHEDVGAVLASFRVLGDLVLLRLATSGHGTHVLLLASDNSDADIRRRLRMRLACLQPDEALPRT